MPFYRCGTNAFLRCREFGKARDPYKSLPGFSELLVNSGYHVMHWGKTTNKAGKRVDRTNDVLIHHFSQAVSAAANKEARKKEVFSYVRENFKTFLDNNSDSKPFFYWFGPHNSHRQWTRGSGKAIWGIDPDSLQGKVPAFLPDVHTVREDLADYLGEAQAWDGMVNELVQELKARDQLDNTLIIVSGDHGMPGMPRGKCNVHDFGSSVSLLVSWPRRVKPGRHVDDFVSLMDIAPTILEATDTKRPNHMLAQSLLGLLESEQSGQIRLGTTLSSDANVTLAKRAEIELPTRRELSGQPTFF